MISKKEVQHIAKLARLGFSKEEIKKFQGELSSILEYIKKLKEVDIEKVRPTSHSVSLFNVARDDEVKKQRPEDVNVLIESAPKIKNRHIKVKSIL